MLDPNDPLVRWGVFGRQVEDFLKSEIGDHLLKRAETEQAEAMDQLKSVAPWRTRRIRDLQNQVKVSESIMLWLGDAIASGHAAVEQLKVDHA